MEMNNILPSLPEVQKEEMDYVSYMIEIKEINCLLDEYEELTKNVSTKQRNFIMELELSEKETQLFKELEERTLRLQLDLKDRISRIQVIARNCGQRSMIDQATIVHKNFLDIISEYRIEQAKNLENAKAQRERQYKIINPHATESELKQVVEADDLNQSSYFQQALHQSNKKGQAKTVLHDVQLRHQEILKLEKTMTDLNQLFIDMEQLIIEQDAPLLEINEKVEIAQNDIELGLKHTEKAVISARKSRKKKLWLILLVILILLVAALVLIFTFKKK